MPSAYDCFVQVARERFAAIDTKLPEKARDAARVPEPLLPHLAWSRGLDYWSAAWTEEQRRAFVAATPANLRRRGTRAAIDSAVEAFEAELVIQEWFEQSPEGVPGTALATVEPGSYIETDVEALTLIRVLLEREGRRSIHWTLAVGVTGAPAIGDEARGRVTSLYQYSGAQTGA